jgi:hypothetical protein
VGNHGHAVSATTVQTIEKFLTKDEYAKRAAERTGSVVRVTRPAPSNVRLVNHGSFLNTPNPAFKLRNAQQNVSF